MNLKHLTKEQKQMAILAVLIAITVFYAGYRFGLGPLLGGRKLAEEELSALKQKVEEADRLMRKRRITRQEYARTRDELRDLARDRIPPLENPLTWATEKIYRLGRTVGVDIESVSEVNSSLPAAAGAAERAFVPYTVQIVTTAGYDKLLELTKTIEASDPHVSITGISVMLRSDSKTQHGIKVLVQWPRWSNPDLYEEVIGEDKLQEAVST